MKDSGVADTIRKINPKTVIARFSKRKETASHCIFSSARKSDARNSRVLSNTMIIATSGSRIFAPGSVEKSGAINMTTATLAARMIAFMMSVVEKSDCRSSGVAFAPSRISTELMPGSTNMPKNPARVMAYEKTPYPAAPSTRAA